MIIHELIKQLNLKQTKRKTNNFSCVTPTTSAVSLWGHALLFRRAAWCYFDEIYRVAGRLGSSQDWAAVDRPAVDELLTVALLSPLDDAGGTAAGPAEPDRVVMLPWEQPGACT